MFLLLGSHPSHGKQLHYSYAFSAQLAGKNVGKHLERARTATAAPSGAA
jgi:hypothetical protein